jgi:hypothetical protein
MASYVSPNFNPAYYELPVFEAPTEMAVRVAQQKQAQFDSGLNQVKNQYQNMLNLDLTSKDAIAKKDAYMKDAERKLRQISTADFSLQENVNSANQIYRPLVSDQHILLDMSATKQNKQAYSQLLSDKNSKDEKLRNNVSSYNEEYIMRKQREMRDMNFEQLQSYNPAKYVRAVNFNELLNKYAKDLGYNYIEQKEDGMYMRKTEGGPASFIGYNTFAKSQLSGNPDAVEYMRVVSEVDYGRDIDRYTQVFGSKEAAKDYIAKEAIKEEYDFRKTLISEQERENKDIEQKINEFFSVYTADQVKTDPKLKEQADQMKLIKERGLQKFESLKLEASKFNPESNDKVPGMDMTQYEINLKNYTQNATSAYTSRLFRNTASNWALGLASINQQKTVTTNEPFFKLKDKEIELIKTQTEALKEQNSKGTSTSPSNMTPGVDFNPLGKNKDAVVTEKYQQFKADQTSTLQKSVELQKQIAVNMLGTDEGYKDVMSYINQAYDDVANGKGSTLFRAKDVSKVVLDKVKEITGQATKMGLFKQGDPITSEVVYKSVNAVLSSKIKANPENISPEVINMFNLSERNGRLTKVYDEIDKDVAKNVFEKNKEKYQGFVSDNKFLTEEEYLSNKYQEKYREFLKDKSTVNVGSPLLMGTSSTTNSFVFDEEGYKKEYNNKKKEFEKDFSKFIDQDPKSQAYGYFRGDSKLGMQFDRIQLKFNDKAGEQNIAENIVPRIFNNKGDLINPLNERDLGLSKDNNDLFTEIMGKLNTERDLKSEDGSLTYSPMSMKGTPLYNFKPSDKSLNSLETEYKGNEKALSLISKIKQFGINYMGSLSQEIESQTASYYSVVARSMGSGSSTDLASTITNLNSSFKGYVSKINDNQYIVKYEVIDPATGKIVTNNRTVPVERLDETVKEVENGIYGAYINYMNKNKQDKGRYDSKKESKAYYGE